MGLGRHCLIAITLSPHQPSPKNLVTQPEQLSMMLKTIIPFEHIPQLAKTDIAYATGDPNLKPFYQYEPRLESFGEILSEKERAIFPRADLVGVLQDQYRTLPPQSGVTANIQALLENDSFTVITAHQPSIFLGPLFFLYKALTTINLAEAVEKKFAGKYRIIPVFVLGSEDHDLEELNSINLFNKKITWETNQRGPVGSMRTSDTAAVLEELKSVLGDSEAAKALFEKIEQAYSRQETIADATQALLHDLFGAYGLVVLNMNDARLKKHFSPIIKAELSEQPSFRIVQDTTARLQEAGFKNQATPREINLFYMLPGMRERIVSEDGKYKVLNTDLVFSEPEMMEEVDAHPERFSPNVVLRPLFQELVLPNLAYVGGGGELAYWLERKALFAHFGVQFPMLVRRNSVLWIDRDAGKKLRKFGFTAKTFFDDPDTLVRAYVERQASVEINLDEETGDLRKIFDSLASKAAAIDPTLEKAVRAEEVKTVGVMEHWQNRLVRAEKQKHEVTLNQMRALKEKMFPGNGLQERHDNFMPYLLKHGDAFIGALKVHLQAFDPGFIVLEEPE